MSNSKFIHFFFLFHFFTIFVSSSSLNNIYKCSQEQSHALLLFKQNLSSINESGNYHCPDWLGSSYYPIMNNWNTNSDCCHWNGVTCDYSTGDVIALSLSCGMLRGTIHSNSSLFHLPHLRTLNLAFNDFSGSQIPREIGLLSNTLTHLNISGCWFSGQVPSEISLLRKLVSLDLSWNFGIDFKLEPHVFISLLKNTTFLRHLSLSAVSVGMVLPTYLNISSSLEYLDLRFTDLTGKLPHNVFNHQHLEALDLSQNSYLTGSLPEVITNTSIPLKYLDLSFCSLVGSIPSWVFSLQHLEELHLSGNTNLTGSLPKVKTNTSIPLKYLSIFRCNLLGSFPSWVFSLQHLEVLELSWNNNLTGSLQTLNPFTNIPLKQLYLEHCNLVGLIPSWVFSLQHLEELDLSWNNNLTGPLPEVNTSTSIPLKHLYLIGCDLVGSVPSWLFSLDSLERLSLRDNKLSGKIEVFDQGPFLHTFPQLTNLTYLDLSYNRFRGDWELDTMLNSLKNLEILRLSHSGLSVVTNGVKGYVNPDFDQLELDSCKIKLFPDSLQAMKNLRYLNLADNQIHGSIPDWVGEIGGDKLSHLNLSQNFISRLPQIYWGGMQSLYLRSNNIEGPFPLSICNMQNLVFVDMSDNNFGGVIPECIGNITVKLQTINLKNNHFQGNIPNAYNACDALQGFILNGNQLEGEVPSSLSKCRVLKVVDLGNNRLNGTFPHWLGDLPNLQVLVLKSNNFHGPIITSSTNEHPFQCLQILDLSHNRFTGQLPQRYFQNFKAMKDVEKNITALQYLLVGGTYYSIIITVKGVEQAFAQIFIHNTIIDVSNNGFQGEIPSIIGSLNSLKALNLSHNNLNGRIPHSLGSLFEIESLDLSWNHLIGEIPKDLTNIKGLAVLNLSQNHLVGRIPEGRQFDTFDGSSFGGNVGLCDASLFERIPLPKCEHSNSQQHKGDGNYEEDDESGFTWKVVLLGYGCGTLIGLVLGYLMLSSGYPKWFNKISNSVEYLIVKRRKKTAYLYIGK